MKKIISILAGILSLQSALSAQDTLVLTLERAIDIAIGRSYTIKSYNQRKQATEHFYRYWEANFKPRLDFKISTPSWNERVQPIERTDGLPVYNSTGTMTYLNDLKFTYTIPTGGNFAVNAQLYRENLKTVLAQQDYTTLTSRKARSSFSLSFDQPIFTRNQLKENLDEARLNFERTSSEFTRRQLNIIYQVTESFYSVYRSLRQVEIAGEKLKNSEEAYRIARLKGEAGRIPEGDVLIAEVSMEQNRAALSEAEGKLERDRDALKQLIGLSLHVDFAIETDLRYDSFEIDESGAIAKALANRQELRESELDVELRRIDLDRARRIKEFSGQISAYYDITGVSTLEHGSSSDLFRSSFDNIVDRPPNRGITLSFSYPVFDWGRGRERVQQQMANVQQAELDLEDQKTSIVREIRDIVRSVYEARNRLLINEKNQSLAQRSYAISRLRFENGNITSQQLGTEQERLADTQLAYLNAFITYQLAMADLKRKTLWDFQNDKIYSVEN